MKEGSNPCFTFTEREKLYDQVSHDHFMAIVMQPDMDIHEAGESTNNFGEYLFVTVSCRTEQPQKLYTFWGLGYHEHRERWIVDAWQWFESYRKAERLPIVSKEEAYALIKECEAFVHAQTTPTKPSRRAGDLLDGMAILSNL